MSSSVISFESANPNEWKNSNFLQKFHSIPKTVYKDDPFYLPKLDIDLENELLRPEFLSFQRSFISGDARLTARIRNEAGDSIGLISHFESINNSQVSRKLFEAAILWLKDHGCLRIFGPIDGDTWHRYRINLGPFERAPFFLEPYNPPYYGKLWEEAGFRILDEYTSKMVENISELKLSFKDNFETLLNDGYQFQKYNPSNFEEELTLLHSLTTSMFKDNRFYSEISANDFILMYSRMRSLLKEDDLHFLIAPDQTPAGFLFAMPDYQNALLAMSKNSNNYFQIFKKIRFFLESKKTKTLNLKTLGIVPEHRKKGMAKALFYKAYSVAESRGLTSANLCLMHKDNPSQKLDSGQGQTFRHYALYELQ